MAIYDFRAGHSLRGVNPQSVGEELERIRSDKGKLTPDDVVEAASDEASPLHAGFEWDDSAAAHQHRLAQARRLIVSIRILDGPIQRSTPAYVSVRTPDMGRSYIPTVSALSDEELRARVLDDIRTALEAIQRRYAAFTDAANLLEDLKRKIA